MSDSPFLIYVVEDDEYYNKLLVHNLSLNPDFVVKSFFSGNDVLSALQAQPAVITLDYRLPDMDGHKLLKKIKSTHPSIEVIIISEQEEIETAIDLFKAGAYDYLVKNDGMRERLLHTVHNIQKNTGLIDRIQVLQQEVERKYDFEKHLIGSSAALKKVLELIQKSLHVNITVTITGETGTGKEVVAKTIHYNSSRKANPFVAVNMAAIPAELIESELFGHEKGAFTGATARRKGKFEEAHGGTLFLDEIGEMDINMQTKLLRALQEREVVRVGGNEVIKFDCRIMVATHKNLLDEVRNGNFREDLYYRLFGLPIHLPPLRERENDILLLSKHFLDRFSTENGLDKFSLSESARKKLMAYQWPGNIRELKSVVELAAVMSIGSEISANDITLGTPDDLLPNLLASERTLRQYEIQIVQHFMQQFNNDTKKVAERLAIGQTTVYRLLKEDQDPS